MECRIRIIPAGAGKSDTAPSRPCGARDHPRGCGEKMAPHGALGCLAGSSPRVRGKGVAGLIHLGGEGIIPAGAGKSAILGFWAKISEDHPRGCGEKHLHISRYEVVQGSSPRVRGKAMHPV